MPVCHGTFGSGVFISGTDILLGPLVTEGTDVALTGKLVDATHGTAWTQGFRAPSRASGTRSGTRLQMPARLPRA